MELKVGDKVRIISYEEALEVYKDNDAIDFGVFKEHGNKVDYVIEITRRGDIAKLSAGFSLYVKSLRKINSLDMKLDKNLFEL